MVAEAEVVDPNEFTVTNLSEVNTDSQLQGEPGELRQIRTARMSSFVGTAAGTEKCHSG